MVAQEKEMCDLERWKVAQKGDSDAFRVLYQRYFNDIYLYLKRLCGDEELSKDTLQETFADVWANRERLTIKSSVRNYLLVSSRRKMVEKLKQNRRFTDNYTDIRSQENLSVIFSHEDFIMDGELENSKNTLLAKALNSLPDRQREAVYLRFFKDMPYKEVADVMGLTEKAAVNFVYKAFRKIRAEHAVDFIELAGWLSLLFSTLQLAG
ncbi:hypothetical protein FUAX_37650 [Fulvitalea axinellae]|uniref:Sigma-70 family RNA polymerase sigma factor n=1 Tax=Fulvitalea axinellae TaxID=1182444 RepID=A0AAU9D5Q3_9BACT|nr:hypothetical protein FUAX_37650 [Fulvitalea axinellae]